MVAAELFGQENGILIIVCVYHIGFHRYVPFCVGDAGIPKESVVRFFTLSSTQDGCIHPTAT